MKDNIKYSLQYSVLSLSISIIFSISISFLLGFTKFDQYVILIAGSICAILFGFIYWYIFIELKYKITLTKTIISGLLTVVSSHYFSFIIIEPICKIYGFYTGNNLSCNIFNNIYSFIPDSFLLLFISIVMFGWITIPLGLIFSIIYYIYRKNIL